MEVGVRQAEPRFGVIRTLGHRASIEYAGRVLVPVPVLEEGPDHQPVVVAQPVAMAERGGEFPSRNVRLAARGIRGGHGVAEVRHAERGVNLHGAVEGVGGGHVLPGPECLLALEPGAQRLQRRCGARGELPQVVAFADAAQRDQLPRDVVDGGVQPALRRRDGARRADRVAISADQRGLEHEARRRVGDGARERVAGRKAPRDRDNARGAVLRRRTRRSQRESRIDDVDARHAFESCREQVDHALAQVREVRVALYDEGQHGNAIGHWRRRRIQPGHRQAAEREHEHRPQSGPRGHRLPPPRRARLLERRAERSARRVARLDAGDFHQARRQRDAATPRGLIVGCHLLRPIGPAAGERPVADRFRLEGELPGALGGHGREAAALHGEPLLESIGARDVQAVGERPRQQRKGARRLAGLELRPCAKRIAANETRIEHHALVAGDHAGGPEMAPQEVQRLAERVASAGLVQLRPEQLEQCLPLDAGAVRKGQAHEERQSLGLGEQGIDAHPIGVPEIRGAEERELEWWLRGRLGCHR